MSSGAPSALLERRAEKRRQQQQQQQQPQIPDKDLPQLAGLTAGTTTCLRRRETIKGDSNSSSASRVLSLAIAKDSPKTAGASTPVPLRSLKLDLANYHGPDLERMKEFSFNKGRVLGACELTDDAFERLSTVAEGDGRCVYRVRHKHTALILAQKTINYDGTPQTHRTLQTELQLLHDCHSPEIINFYGSFITGSNVNIIMEWMDGSCLDNVVDRIGRIDELPMAVITKKVLNGLLYLEEQQVIHRDLKPANILCNTLGEIKLCDFGVSRKLLTTRAYTFVGTMRYMAPERLEGKDYTVKSDVWSLGLSIMEMVTGSDPITPDAVEELPLMPKRDPDDEKKSRRRMNLAVFDVMASVVHSKVPRLPIKTFSKSLETFVSSSLQKEPTFRPDLQELMIHPWIKTFADVPFDLAAWVKSTLPRKTPPSGSMDGEEEEEVCVERANRIALPRRAGQVKS